ncbi:MAG: hypothetical protein LBQ39_07045 [Tannerellaceae bacterium]|jgi:hypothetical protein|nr:hypothetical protein [Tannerellaceae bacterium]
MTAKEKEHLKNKLPKGWRLILESETGYSAAYIGKVLSGERHSFIIEKAAVVLARKFQSELKDIENLIKEIS